MRLEPLDATPDGLELGLHAAPEPQERLARVMPLLHGDRQQLPFLRIQDAAGDPLPLLEGP